MTAVLRRCSWIGVLFVDAAAVTGITAVVGAIALAVLVAGGSSVSTQSHGTLVLEGGSVLHFKSDAEYEALTETYRGRIRSASFEPASALPAVIRVFFPAIYIAGLAYVAYRERRRLRAWLRVGLRRIAIGFTVGLATVVVGGLYESAARHLGYSFEALELPLRPIGPIAFFLLAAFAAPITEELYFRGRLFRLVEERNGGRAAVWITTVLFAVLHVPTLPVALPPYLVMSFLLGWQRLRNGTLDGSIATHATHNAVAVAAAALLGR